MDDYYISTGSYCRGWPVVWEFNQDVSYAAEMDWSKVRVKYSDNGEICAELDPQSLLNDEGVQRPCKQCGAHCSTGEPDPCLGYLEGVKNACCGHGVKGLAYIQFDKGLTIREFYMDPRSLEKKKEAK